MKKKDMPSSGLSGKRALQEHMPQAHILQEQAPQEHAQHVIMVCVTRQKTCERLILEGKRIAEERQAPLHVVHAVKTGENFLGNAFEGEALEYLFTAASASNGNLSVLRADDVEAALRDYANTHSADVMVLGQSPLDSKSSFVSHMRLMLPDMVIKVI